MDLNIKTNKASNIAPESTRRKKRKLRNRNAISKDITPTVYPDDQIEEEEANETFETNNKGSEQSRSKNLENNKRSHDVKNAINKKIKFDESGEVKSIKDKPKKKGFNDEEAEVKDEDIDKFCDELDDEDNKQYENWVKLFEENFRSNKKKKT